MTVTAQLSSPATNAQYHVPTGASTVTINYSTGTGNGATLENRDTNQVDYKYQWTKAMGDSQNGDLATGSSVVITWAAGPAGAMDGSYRTTLTGLSTSTSHAYGETNFDAYMDITLYGSDDNGTTWGSCFDSDQHTNISVLA